MTNKSPDAFRTISEVAEWLGVPTHVLRFWESRFAQVKPVKRAGGRRYYRPADMELLGGIRKLLHEDGMTIRGVQKLLREQGVKHVAELSPDINDLDLSDASPSNVVTLDVTASVDAEELTATLVSDDAPASDTANEPDTPSIPRTEEALTAGISEPNEADPEPQMPPETPQEIPAGPEESPPDAPVEAPPEPPLEIPGDMPDEAVPEETTEISDDSVDDDSASDMLMDSPEALDFLAHDADVTPPMETMARNDQAEPMVPEPPATLDISHIPDDPVEDDGDLSAGEDGLLTNLRNAQKTSAWRNQNAGELGELNQRLLALKNRMNRERRQA